MHPLIGVPLSFILLLNICPRRSLPQCTLSLSSATDARKTSNLKRSWRYTLVRHTMLLSSPFIIFRSRNESSVDHCNQAVSAQCTEHLQEMSRSYHKMQPDFFGRDYDFLQYTLSCHLKTSTYSLKCCFWDILVQGDKMENWLFSS